MSSTLSFLNYRKADLPKLCNSLCNATESYAVDFNDIDKSWSELKTIITCSCLCSVPRVSIRTRPSPKWFNASIRHQLNKARSLCRRIKKHPTPNLHGKLNQLEANLQSDIESAKEKFLTNLVASFKNNPKKLYEYLNNLSQSNYDPHYIIHNVVIQDPQRRVSIFNEYFNSTFNSNDIHLPPIHQLPASDSYLCSISLTESEVYQCLMELDASKTMGCDSIHPSVLKYCDDCLTSPIASLFNLSLALCRIPQ